MNKPFIMTDNRSDPQAETEVGVLYPAEVYEQEPSAPPVTRLHDIVDGDRNEEVTVLSRWAGASSEDPAGSGVPSAETQHRQHGEGLAE